MEKQRDLFCGLTYACYNRLGYFIMKFKVVAHYNTMACGIRTYHKAIYIYVYCRPTYDTYMYSMHGSLESVYASMCMSV